MRFLWIVWCLVALPVFTSAATSDFSVRQFVGTDTNPPTVPVLVSLTPLTSTQIDIVWNPAVDDVLLGGYTVARDGTHIATTTLTTFSDTGLTSVTLYEYTVRAFDWLGNVSSSSIPLATSTLALPSIATSTPATTTANGITSSGRLMLSGQVSVVPTVTTAVFNWSTSRPARFELRFGRTTSYELGFVTTERYRTDNQTTLTDLIPGTTYFYELVGYSTLNTIPQIIARGQFTTPIQAHELPTPNVSQLTARKIDRAAFLSWRNPQIAGAYTVRIVRNHLQYPTDVHDGEVVYQGRDESYLDNTSLVTQQKQYYSVFVIDAQGNFSSGAIVTVAYLADGGGSTEVPGEIPAEVVLPALVEPLISLPDLELTDIMLIQKNGRKVLGDGGLTLDASTPFTVSIDAARLPKQLKSIIVTLLNPADYNQSYSFLLRLNQDQTAYEATLAAVDVVGISRLLVEVYNYDARVVGRYAAQVEFTPSPKPLENTVLFPDALIARSAIVTQVGAVLTAVLLFSALFFMLRRRAKGRVR